MAKRAKNSSAITNRRARYDYELGDALVVGIALTGPETKALRLSHGNLTGAHVNVLDNELWLINAQIMPAPGVPIPTGEQSRSRKLLARRSEINKLIAAKQAGRTIVPLEIQNKGRYIKLKIALGRGKKRYDKRETIKKRQQERDAKRSAA